jgi:hypothetical protein
MFRASAEQVLLEASKSPELDAALQIVADAEVYGRPKFSRCTVRELGRAVVCRSYAPALLELCHLLVIAEALGARPRRYEDFFWNSGPATASGFRAYAGMHWAGEDLAAPGLRMTETGVDCAYPDGRFAVNFGRMAFLSAMMEFLITALGYAELDNLCTAMFAQGPSKARVAETANALSRMLYSYLGENLTSAQQQRKFASLVAYLSERGGGDFGPETIDDAAVLTFWLAQSDAKSARGTDFRTYLSVLRSFVHLRQSLEAARDLHALRGPRPIGTNREAGEIDPGEVVDLIDGIEEEDNPLRLLAQAPAKNVKFLTKAEATALELLFDSGRTAAALPVSLMRGEAFGPSQARISQALRRKLAGADLASVIEDSFGVTYQERRAHLASLIRHLDGVLLASLHVLVRARHREALALIVEIAPGVDLRPLAQVLTDPAGEGKIVALTEAGVARRLIEAIEDPEIAGPELAELMSHAGGAFRSLARMGFRRGDMDDPDCIEGFASGAPAVWRLRQRLVGFGNALARVRLPHGDWTQQFEADREVFRGGFLALYGDAL